MEEIRKDFYVYIHRRRSDNEVFYVGKGTGRRAWSKNKRNEWWKNIVAKHGRSVELVETNLSEEDSYDLEVELIKFYRESGHNLCNLTDGGGGTVGYVFTKETRGKLIDKWKCPEHRDKMKIALSRPVLCSNGMIFRTCTDAQIWLGKNKQGSEVSACCRRKSYSAQGYVWRFLDDCQDMKDVMDKGLDPYVEWGLEEKGRGKKFPTRAVYCNNGLSFESISLAVSWLRSLGFKAVQTSSITDVCNGRKLTVRGYIFSYNDIFSSSISNKENFLKTENPEKCPDVGEFGGLYEETPPSNQTCNKEILCSLPE